MLHRYCCRRRGRPAAAIPGLVVLMLLAAALPPTNTAAGELPELFRGIAAPFRMAHRERPSAAAPHGADCDDPVARLAEQIDWLEHHLDAHGSIVAKHPDVWGQSRLMRHRQEYEEELRRQLGRFESRSNAALRRSDQSFLGMALALQAASGRRRGGQDVPLPSAGGSSSVVNQIQSLLPTTNESLGRSGDAVIARTEPLGFEPNPEGFRFPDGPIALEPTIHLDQLSRYLNHLHELRRINEGDDVADAPGYALTLVRIPVSVLPGGRTRRGHGAEITFTAEPVLDDDLLPRTFRALVINDLVDLVAPALAWCVNDSECVRWAAEAAGDDSDRHPAGRNASQAILELARRLPTASPAAAPALKTRLSRLPIPFTQLVEASGVRQIAVLIRDTHRALAGHPTSRPCIGYGDVRGFLEEELAAAYDFLATPALAASWQELSGWNLARLIRGRRGREIDIVRCRFLASVGTGDELPLPPADGDICCEPPGSHRPICRTTTAVLAWGILVESALLDLRLGEDLARVGVACEGAAGPFYGPDPGPEAREAFERYVLSRWPLHVFALDPVVQEQNVEDSYARRRETQIALAMAFASGRISAQTLTRSTRRLETDMATIALNRTAVGFSHGSDTFGWRFYPRVQSPPDRGRLASFTETLCGPSSDADLAGRCLEPGMRECTAILVVPSFVPGVSFDVRSNWFALAHPRATEPSMREAMKFSRAVAEMRQTAPICEAAGHRYRPGEVVRLLKRIEQLDRELPLQSLRAQLPYENTSGGFELFSSGVTGLAPELVGWYGAPGIDPGSTTTLYLIGRGFSVHDTSVVAGGRRVPITLISREVLRAEIPSGVRTLAAGAVFVPPSLGEPKLPPPRDVEELPPPQAADGGPALPSPIEPCLASPAACQARCNDREVVDIHLATPYGVTSHLLVPVERSGTRSSQEPAFADAYAMQLAFTTAKSSTSPTPVARVDEFYSAGTDAILVRVPAGFIPPAKGSLNFTLRDTTPGREAGGPAATFGISLPPFDGRRSAYVLTGEDLRNFVGDTSRPATDKTIRGAVKPYLDELLATGGAPAPGESLPMLLTARLAAEGRELPVAGGIELSLTRRDPENR